MTSRIQQKWQSPSPRPASWRVFEFILGLIIFALTACQVSGAGDPGSLDESGAEAGEGASIALAAPAPSPIPPPTRPAFSPGELVDYIAQTGDTLPGLAAHFNTTVGEILAANPIIPESVKTLPPGLPMQVPIYFKPLWGSSYQILPDSLFINGPAQVDFDTTAFIAGYPGWLSSHVEYAAGANRTAAQVVDVIARDYSVSPRLLLALLEYHAGALTQPDPSTEERLYPLGKIDRARRGLYLQLSWTANLLNNGYYRYRMGDLDELTLKDGRLERPDPWQNAATVSLQNYYATLLPADDYAWAISSEGLAGTYRTLFGDPWAADQPHIPGSLEQPQLALPFEPGRTWAYTGGPHTAWGEGEPLAALDFAPPAVVGGCQETDEWATAAAPGIVARSELGTVVLDLDGDGDERTGWVIFYFHIGTEGRAPAGRELQTGDRIGHPSCEGGRTTGTHIHIARKFNGEWIRADGPLAFDLGGWVARAGDQPYKGSLTRFDRTLEACECSNQASQITAEKP